MDLQLPKPGAAVPSRSELDVMAVRIVRALQDAQTPELTGREDVESPGTPPSRQP